MTPGIQPAAVSRKTIKNEPQPLSITERGGKIIANIALKQDILGFPQKYKNSLSIFVLAWEN